MKTTDINKLLFLLVVLLTMSCSLDDVSVDNGTDFTEKNLIKDEKSANIVLRGIYGGFITENMVLFPLALMTSGTESALSLAGDTYGVREFADNNIQASRVSSSDGFYRETSYIINTSNYFIAQIEAGKAEDLSEKRKKEMIGEARTLRAYARFTLLRTYGQFYDINSKYGIVISNKPIKSKDKFSRKSVKESYDAIIADLEYGINNNPETNVNVKLTETGEMKMNIKNSYVTRTTAKAFLAKVYLYKKDYEKAQTLADEVINMNTGGYALESTYEAIYSKKWQSTEALFVPYRHGLLKGFSVLDSGEIYKLPYIYPTDYFKNLANAQVPSEQGDINYMFGYDPRFIFTLRAGDIRNNKYPSPPFTIGNTVYYMRMGEMYLIYAEAFARNKNNSDLTLAVNAVNEIRRRANNGVSPDKSISPISSTDKSEILDLIRQEKMLELFAETGEPWFDLVRYLDAGDLTFDIVKQQKKTLTEKTQLTFPVPLKVMRGNDKMEQNPGS